MIPLKLSITHFLSYRETAVLDFDGLHLACIAGLNGAGKSTIIDAMTWALFGQSRSRSDDDVVNRLSARADETAEIIFDFELEGVAYRIMRRKRHSRAMTVEFLVATDYAAEQWKALTGTGRRETDSEIVQLLRMNFDTFSNASFLLQGRADEFTTKTAGKRKEVLADLLGVNRWDRFKDAATIRRKAAENTQTLLDSQIGEIELELAEEPTRQESLNKIRAEYELVSQQLKVQETLLEQGRRQAETIKRQRAAVEQAAVNLARERKRLEEWQNRRVKMEAERAESAALLAEEEAIKAGFAAWETALTAVEVHQERANEYNRLKQAQQPHELAIEREKSRLTAEERNLRLEKQRLSENETEKSRIEKSLVQLQGRLEQVTTQLSGLETVREQISALQNEQAGLESQQPFLKEQMEAVKERMTTLESSTGGSCPLCGQPLTEEHRLEMLTQLQGEGTEQGDRFRANKTRLPQIAAEITRFDSTLKQQKALEKEKESVQQEETRNRSRLADIEQAAQKWASAGEAELARIQKQLQENEILPKAQAELARLSAEIETAGYDPQEHEAAAARRDALKEAPARLQAWETARSTVNMLDKNLAEQVVEIEAQEKVVADLTVQHDAAQGALAALTGEQEQDLPNLEREIQKTRQAEIEANRRVGRAEQLLTALDRQRERRDRINEERAELTQQISRLKMLEKACGRDGVQALLIEQALPEIEDATNRLLDRLTEGQMQVTFETQKQLKSRDGTAETLDIHIADNAGIRPYENFSGGEQFRVNFAIRIALSQILAKRAGARLQTLVIDEGFGSQDPNGRQRLTEAINAIQDDFKRILVITHIDELRDAFPNRIDVVKTPRGSQLSVS